MFMSSAESIFFKSRAECFSNTKLHSLDKYWSINNSHPMHNQMHEIIENILNARGEKTCKQSRLDLVRKFERSLSISTPMGRLSASIISFASCFVLSKINQTTLSIPIMSSQYKSLIEARNQWQMDIKMYKDFFRGETKTFEGRYGAEEYISMAENRLKDINLKLKEIELESLTDAL